MSACQICGKPECRSTPPFDLSVLQERDRGYWKKLHGELDGQPPPLPPWLRKSTAEYPSLATQAGNALRAAAGFVADGFKTVSDEEQARRLEVCRACEHFDASQGRCALCGCLASLKARVASQHCPDDPPRW